MKCVGGDTVGFGIEGFYTTTLIFAHSITTRILNYVGINLLTLSQICTAISNPQGELSQYTVDATIDIRLKRPSILFSRVRVAAGGEPAYGAAHRRLDGAQVQLQSVQGNEVEIEEELLRLQLVGRKVLLKSQMMPTNANMLRIKDISKSTPFLICQGLSMCSLLSVCRIHGVSFIEGRHCTIYRVS